MQDQNGPPEGSIIWWFWQCFYEYEQGLHCCPASQEKYFEGRFMTNIFTSANGGEKNSQKRTNNNNNNNHNVDIDHTNKWYMDNPAPLLENDTYKSYGTLTYRRIT